MIFSKPNPYRQPTTAPHSLLHAVLPQSAYADSPLAEGAFFPCAPLSANATAAAGETKNCRDRRPRRSGNERSRKTRTATEKKTMIYEKTSRTDWTVEDAGPYRFVRCAPSPANGASAAERTNREPSLVREGGPRPGFPEANLQSLGDSRRSGGRSTRP